MLRADLRRCVYFWLLCSLIIIIRIKLTDRFTYSLQYQKSRGILRRVRPVSEIVYESRGKLIGGSLSRLRKANSRPSENEGGDSGNDSRLIFLWLSSASDENSQSESKLKCDQKR